MVRLLEQICKTIRDFRMFDRGDKVIVAVSGGPDSMCLLHLLSRVSEEFGITLVAAHVNHGLRGEEADQDELYVRDFCSKHQIDFRSRKVDIQKLAEIEGISCETAGRNVRYDFFSELLTELSAQKVSLAHNANDQAETILMRIMRGTGAEGLVGIKPVRDEIYVRPLLYTSRKNIEEYCEVNGINPRIDKTNSENIYTRNKIRLELIPYIEKNFNKEIITTLNRMSEALKIDNEYIDRISNEKYTMYCEKLDKKVIINKKAFVEDEALVTRILRKAFSDLVNHLYNVDRVHIYDIMHLQKQETGRKINLPNKVTAYNNYGTITLSIENSKVPVFMDNQYSIPVEGNIYIPEKGVSVKTKIKSKEDKINIKADDNVKYFDFDKIQGTMTVRYRREGDRFTPIGMKGSRKLKDIFIDLKIPREERDQIPLICFDKEIAWVIGYNISEKYKIDQYTKKILEIKIESGDKYGARH